MNHNKKRKINIPLSQIKKHPNPLSKIIFYSFEIFWILKSE